MCGTIIWQCREGFFSKLESSASTSANNAESDTSFGDQNNGESEYPCRESHMSGISTSPDSEIAADGNMSQREMSPEYEGHEQEVSLYNEGIHQELSRDVRIAHYTEEQDFDDEATGQEISAAEVAGAVSRQREEMTSEYPLEIEDINQSGPHDVFLERHEPGSGLSSILEADALNADLERNTDEPDRLDNSSQLDEFHESVTETQERAWQQLTSVDHTEWGNGTGGSIANQLYRETSDNDVLEQDQMQGSHEDWPSHDLQEAIDSWLDMPSGEGASVERTDTYYFSDDDNVHSMELRELFSRFVLN